MSSLTGRNINAFQPVEITLPNKKLSTSYFIFHGRIALGPTSYAAKMFAVKMSMAKMFMAEIADTLGIATQTYLHQVSEFYCFPVKTLNLV